MNVIKCEKCGTDVPGAKAFCPECGSAMVDEETRTHTSEHETYDSTMHLSKSSYNLMLADMDLNISDAPNLTAERINLSKELKLYAIGEPEKASKPPGIPRWLIAAGIAVVFLLLVSLVLAVFIFRRLFTGG